MGIREEAIEAGARAIDALPVEQHDYSACAEAAFDAILSRLQDPDEEMLDRGVDNLFGSTDDDWKVDARQVFRAMLEPLAKRS